MSFDLGGCSGFEAAGAVEAADVDGSSAPEEGYGVVFCGGFDVLLFACYCGEADACEAFL